MKKKIMGLIAVVAIAAIAGYNMLTSPNDVKLSGLAMVNMEALAQGESSGGNCNLHLVENAVYVMVFTILIRHLLIEVVIQKVAVVTGNN